MSPTGRKLQPLPVSKWPRTATPTGSCQVVVESKSVANAVEIVKGNEDAFRLKPRLVFGFQERDHVTGYSRNLKTRAAGRTNAALQSEISLRIGNHRHCSCSKPSTTFIAEFGIDAHEATFDFK